SFTFYATAEAVVRAGATPVFADIDPATLNVDPDDVAAKLTERTKAIMPVHLFGRPADLEALARLGVPIVEDAAQAFGARGVATVGVASTFSFFPTKNLFALGDGGLVAATDENLADRVRMLRFHGSKDKQSFSYIGTNSRLDEIQAAALRLFLGELDGWNRARREAAARYSELGLGEFCALPEDEPGHVYHMYVVRTSERARVADGSLVALAWFLAFELRFDHGVPIYYDTLFRRTVLIVVGIKLLVFILFGFYDRWWRYVSTRDMWSAARGVTIASLVADVTVYFASPVSQVRLPRSIAVMDWLLCLALIAGSRLLAR